MQMEICCGFFLFIFRFLNFSQTFIYSVIFFLGVNSIWLLLWLIKYMYLIMLFILRQLPLYTMFFKVVLCNLVGQHTGCSMVKATHRIKITSSIWSNARQDKIIKSWSLVEYLYLIADIFVWFNTYRSSLHLIVSLFFSLIKLGLAYHSNQKVYDLTTSRSNYR